jgi:CheY-like chemotaxis protein
MNDKSEVLIVEDNPGDAYLIKELLKDLKLDLSISIAGDGQEALRIFGDKQVGTFKLVILDLNLPKIDGFEVLTHMKASRKLADIPVVVMTGSLRREDRQRSLELGAVDYIIKPSTVEEMDTSERRLRSLLEPLTEDRKVNDGHGQCSRLDLENAGSERQHFRGRAFIKEALQRRTGRRAHIQQRAWEHGIKAVFDGEPGGPRFGPSLDRTD